MANDVAVRSFLPIDLLDGLNGGHGEQHILMQFAVDDGWVDCRIDFQQCGDLGLLGSRPNPEADPARFAPDRFPVWIWMDEPSFYGIPTYGEAGPKAAQDAGGQVTTPETRTFERDDAMFERVRRFVETYLPGAGGPELLTKTCLYTLTPDRDFVVDRVPDAPGVVVGLGAGHGFKFASVLGRVLVELALDDASPSDREIGAFRIDRPILLEVDPPTSWLV